MDEQEDSKVPMPYPQLVFELATKCATAHLALVAIGEDPALPESLRALVQDAVTAASGAAELVHQLRTARP